MNMRIIEELHKKGFQIEMMKFIQENNYPNHKEIIINRGIVNQNIDFIEKGQFNAIIEIDENTINNIMMYTLMGMRGIQKKYGAKDKINNPVLRGEGDMMSMVIVDPFTGKQFILKLQEHNSIILTITND